MLKLGSVLEASPSYQAAVARQQAKEREKALLAAAVPQTRQVMLFAPNAMAKIVHIPVDAKQQAVDDAAERERLYSWFLMAEYNSDKPNVQIIIEVNARNYGLAVALLKKPRGRGKIKAAKSDAIADIRLKRPDVSLSQIGREMGGRDHTTIIHWLSKRGLSKPRHVMDGNKARRMFAEGMNTDEIADVLGFSIETVRKAVQKIESKPTIYARNRRRILRFAGQGMTTRQIAKACGFAYRTVSRHLLIAKKEGQL